MVVSMGRPADAGVTNLPRLGAWLSLLSLVGLLLIVVGRPLGTDDVWWHLALGEQYAAHGPYLDQDPLLHTAERPPAPAAWLFDLSLFATERAVGFQGLRVTHVAMVVVILSLAYSILRRESGSPVIASLATCAYASVAWYRFVQLRAGLVTVIVVLLLYRLLVERAPPSWRRVIAAVLLIGVSANFHAAFLIGPLLLVAVLLGVGLQDAMLRVGGARLPGESGGVDSARYAGRIAAALAFGLLASMVNPQGIGQHLAFFAASPSPALANVADDWMRFDPFAFGDPRTRLGPLVWIITDALLILVPLTGLWNAIRFLRHPSRDALRAADPVLFGLAVASLVAILSAVRFQWMTIFPLLFLLRAVRGSPLSRLVPGRWARGLAATTCAILVPSFVACSGYSLKAFGVPSPASVYLEMPFSTVKYYSNAVWFLSDSELEGDLWNDYSMGGYVGYWLTPRIRAFVNGTLNFPSQVPVDSRAIKARRGGGPGESFLDVLDRYSVDLFLGIGLPVLRDTRPRRSYTTAHLERAEGWILVFRDLRSAVYLRDNPENRENLARVEGYYAGENVPFDAQRGFDPAAVVRKNPAWAAAHGLVPQNFMSIVAASESADEILRVRALDRLAGLFAVLDAHEMQLSLDERLIRLRPEQPGALRRLVRSCVALGRPREAQRWATRLAAADSEDPQTRVFVTAAHRGGARRAPFPFLNAAEAAQLMEGVARPPTRRR